MGHKYNQVDNVCAYCGEQPTGLGTYDAPCIFSVPKCRCEQDISRVEITQVLSDKIHDSPVWMATCKTCSDTFLISVFDDSPEWKVFDERRTRDLQS